MTAFFASFLFWAGAVQDGPENDSLRRLIRDLEHDDVAVRERAERDLEAAGEAAAPALRRLLENSQGTQNELTLRAAAVLRRIERAAKIRAAYRDPAPLRVDVRDADLRAALAEIERQAGVRFEDPPRDVAARITLAADGRPLLAVLDDLSRRAGISYQWKDDRTIRLLPEPLPPYPAAYPGPFAVRVVELRLERRTDFKERTARVRLQLETDYERSLKPLGFPSVTLREARDDRGSALEVREGVEDVESPLAAVRVLVRPAARGLGASPERRAFALSGVALGAGKISLQGTVRALFPLESGEIRLKPEAGAQAEAGQVRIRVERATAGRLWMLTFAPADGTPDESFLETVAERLDEESLVAVDDQGAEHKGTFVRTPEAAAVVAVRNARKVPADPVRAVYQAAFPALGPRAVREIRFRFVTDTYVKEMPFALEGVELP